MKILFIITGLGVGGAENVLANLADGLVERGCEVKIICLKGEVLVKPKSDKIEIINFNGLSNIFSIYNHVKKIIKNFQPNIVHAHMFHSIILARLLKIKMPINNKLICTAHSKAYGGKFRALLYRLTNRFSDLNTNVSLEATEFFIENNVFKKNNTTTVTNGVDAEKFKLDVNKRKILRRQFGFTHQDHIFIAVGRFNEAKDYPNLLKAFSLYLKSSKSYAKLVIVGDGELRHILEKLIIDYQLDKNVSLLGIRTDIADLLNMADTFVLSSAWEGFGLVIAEAMATEKVVMATDCGGVREVLGSSDFLIPIQDSNALAEKMVVCSNMTKAECEQIGYQNRQRILNKYSLNAMVEQWLRLYNS